MNDMFKQINAREKLIGWYHSGPKLRASDLEINELFKRYTPNPLLVIIDVQPKEAGVPTDAYFAVEEIKDVRIYSELELWRIYADVYLLGWNNHLKDLRTHTVDHRSRGSRGDWSRAFAERYPRRGCWDVIDENHEPAAIIAGSPSSTTRHWAISPESP